MSEHPKGSGLTPSAVVSTGEFRGAEWQGALKNRLVNSPDEKVARIFRCDDIGCGLRVGFKK